MLRSCLDAEAHTLLLQHRAWCSDPTLIRFLIARDWNVEAASKLLKEALRWRDKRKPDWILNDPGSFVAQRFKKEAETGKVRVPGRDKYGRAVMVFDNSVENTQDDEWHMNFVAWNTMFAARSGAAGVDKICLVLHLDRFSMFCQPPMWVTRETIAMLTKGFPETLGTCILFQPPAAFMKLYSMIKYLIDPKPRSKFHFVKGDCSKGSENDAKLCYLIGDNWRELTGCDLKPVERRYSEFHGREIDCSPGFSFEKYWADVLLRERAHADAHPELLCKPELEVSDKKTKLDLPDPVKPRSSGLLQGTIFLVAGLLVTAILLSLSLTDYVQKKRV